MAAGRAPLVTWSGLGRAFVDLSMVALCLAFAWAQGQEFVRSRRPSALIVLATELLFAAFFLVRRPADRVSRSGRDWLAAVGGVAVPLLLRPGGAAGDLAVAQLLQLLGGAGALLALLQLNLSVGVVPAHRAVRSAGAYRLVRHPLYAAYLVSYAGYVLGNPSVSNAAVLALGSALQVARLLNEERFLWQYPEYRSYARRTRWRLLPYVF
jgi:protein-S-isoprenylcysteine O-methyltransferase Ste14